MRTLDLFCLCSRETTNSGWTCQNGRTTNFFKNWTRRKMYSSRVSTEMVSVLSFIDGKLIRKFDFFPQQSSNRCVSLFEWYRMKLNGEFVRKVIYEWILCAGYESDVKLCPLRTMKLIGFVFSLQEQLRLDLLKTQREPIFNEGPD